MEELDRAGVILDDARAPRVVFGRLRVRRRRVVVVAPTHCRRADGASFGGVREQEDEVRGAEATLTRKVPPKRQQQTGTDENDIMLEAADEKR